MIDDKFDIDIFAESFEWIYEVCKLSNETGNVAPDLVTLRRLDSVSKDVHSNPSYPRNSPNPCIITSLK
ncbi:hypothetical protein NQ318_016010 [Aromia moschata]|uniref:Uncharacterized protein n=1 Tax=Aromia moschata TaxID=1265417 RepID=A0AAV8XK25_9CUCU|nr:hypothetical protein NQ318_016010 [Aromia moschata]